MVLSCKDLADARDTAANCTDETIYVLGTPYGIDELIGCVLVMVDGDNEGLMRTITGNAANSITVAALDSAPDEGDSFFVVKGDIRATHYRYYDTDDSDGREHQLKAVYEAEAIQAIIDDYSGGGDDITEPADLLDKADSFNDGNQMSQALSAFASRSFTYYTSDLETFEAEVTGTPWGGDDNLDEMYTDTSTIEVDEVPDDSPGYVKSETINSSCGGCGGGSGVGITKTYYYMAINQGASPTADEVVHIIVEDTTANSGSDKVCRQIFGLNPDGILLRHILIEDPASPSYWCKSVTVGTSGVETNQPQERRMPSAHTAVDSKAEFAKFLDPAASSNDDDTLSTDAGLIYVYEHNADGRVTGTRIKKGRSDQTATYVSATNYGAGSAKHMTVATYVYDGVPTTTRTSGVKTEYAYDYRGAYDVATATTILPQVTTAQNGSNLTQVATQQWYDSKGRLRWTQDAEGTVTYYSYHPDMDVMTYMMVDVDTDDLPAEITNGSSHWVAWSGNPPFSQTAESLELVTKYEYDDLGQRTKEVGPAGMTTYTIYKANETRVYPGWYDSGGSDYKTYLPVQVTVTDGGGTLTESYSFDSDADDVELDDSGGAPTGSDTLPGTPRNAYTSWSKQEYNSKGQLVKAHRYYDCAGSEYLTTEYKYNARGQQERVIAPDDSIAWTEYDNLGRPVQTWIGTDDDDGETGDPGKDDSNMVQVSATEYDSNGVGDGNVTKTKRYRDESNSYDTTYEYDWRNRLEETTGPDNVIVLRELDNLGRAKKVETYADSGNGTPESGELRSRSETKYDNRGRVYQTIVHEIDPDDGTVRDRLTTNYWRDEDGRQIKTANPNGLFTKTTYDGAGRVTATYLSYDTTDEATSPTYAEADDLTDDIVIEQTLQDYDKASNVWLQRNFKRKSSDTTTEEALTRSIAWVTYAAYWYDDAHRRIKTVYYGTNEGGDDLDEKSDDFNPEVANTQDYDETTDAPAPRTSFAAECKYICTVYEYDGAGRQYKTIDNMSRETVRTYDDLGRVTKVVENYDDGDVDAGDYDKDRITEYEYDTKGRLATLIADVDSGTDDQFTCYIYGSAFNNSWPTEVLYPDTQNTGLIQTDTIWSYTGGSDHVTIVYDRLGRKTEVTDQRTVDSARWRTRAADSSPTTTNGG